jgi:hypothetical protein
VVYINSNVIIFAIGPITEADTIIESKLTPRCTLKYLVVGDATQIQMLPSGEYSHIPNIREVLPLVQEMPVHDDDVFLIAHAKTGMWFFIKTKK